MIAERIERSGWMATHPITGHPTHVVTREWFDEKKARCEELELLISPDLRGEHTMQGWTTHATTDNEAQAAAIALRLIEEEGCAATTRDVADLVAEGYPIRSAHRYAVLAWKTQR